jgi:hypothetical protein
MWRHLHHCAFNLRLFENLFQVLPVPGVRRRGDRAFFILDFGCARSNISKHVFIAHMMV